MAVATRQKKFQGTLRKIVHRHKRRVAVDINCVGCMRTATASHLELTRRNQHTLTKISELVRIFHHWSVWFEGIFLLRNPLRISAPGPQHHDGWNRSIGSVRNVTGCVEDHCFVLFGRGAAPDGIQGLLRHAGLRLRYHRTIARELRGPRTSRLNSSHPDRPAPGQSRAKSIYPLSKSVWISLTWTRSPTSSSSNPCSKRPSIGG